MREMDENMPNIQMFHRPNGNTVFKSNARKEVEGSSNRIVKALIVCEWDLSTFLVAIMFLPARRRPQGLVVIGVYLSVCLSVCLSVRTLFVRKISQERVHGSPPNLVGGSMG